MTQAQKYDKTLIMSHWLYFWGNVSMGLGKESCCLEEWGAADEQMDG